VEAPVLPMIATPTKSWAMKTTKEKTSALHKTSIQLQRRMSHPTMVMVAASAAEIKNQARRRLRRTDLPAPRRFAMRSTIPLPLTALLSQMRRRVRKGPFSQMRRRVRKRPFSQRLRRVHRGLFTQMLHRVRKEGLHSHMPRYVRIGQLSQMRRRVRKGAFTQMRRRALFLW
jgi:hypothetical protein